jgi:WD40 repeat protein
MRIKPLRISDNVSTGYLHQIHNLNSKNFVLISKYSSIYQFELKTLTLVKKSPLLHPNFIASNLININHRTFVTLNCTIHVLDFFVPLTRLKVFNKPISNMIRFEKKIFLFSELGQEGYILDIWTLNFLKSIKPRSKILSLAKSGLCIKHNLIFFYTGNREIEIWDINLLKNICTLNFSVFIDLKKFYLFYNKNRVFLYLGKNLLYICDFKNKSKSKFYRNKKFENLENFIVINSQPEIFFIYSKKNFYWIKKKEIGNCSFQGHVGKINFIGLINQKLFLTNGFYDNIIAIHYFDKKKMNFKLIKRKLGRNHPIHKNFSFKLGKNEEIIKNRFKNINSRNLKKYKKIGGTMKSKKPNKLLDGSKSLYKNIAEVEPNQIFVKRELYNSNYYKIIVFFFRDPKIWIGTLLGGKQSIEFFNPVKNEKNLYNISCLCISKKFEIALIGFENNSISLLCINQRKFFFHGKNHDFFDPKFRCKINFCELDSSETLFLTYCSHGIFNLWSLIVLKIKKTLILKGLNQVKWSKKRDLISVSAIFHKIFVIIPQKFYVVRVLSGHFGKIKDLLFIQKDRYLISSSVDKTIKIWDLLENICSDTIKFTFSPTKLSSGKNSSEFYVSNENTIEIGKWGISFKKTIELNFPIKKNLVKKEKNFRFFSDNIVFCQGFLNKKISINKEKTKNKNCNYEQKFLLREKYIHQQKRFFSKNFSDPKNKLNLDLEIYHFFIKKTKKLLLSRINSFELMIENKTICKNNFRMFAIKLKKEVILLSLLINEYFQEVLNLEKIRKKLYSLQILSGFCRFFNFDFFCKIYQRLPIDLIDLY